MSQKAQHPDDFANRFDSAFGRLQVAVLDACRREEEWPERVGAAIAAALDICVAEPAAAQVLTIEAKYHPDDEGRRYRRMVDYFAELLATDAPREFPRPAITEEAMVGALAAAIVDALYGERLDRLRARASDLIEFVLIPYLDTGEAKARAQRRRF
jgi:hypothetical protein